MNIQIYTSSLINILTKALLFIHLSIWSYAHVNLHYISFSYYYYYIFWILSGFFLTQYFADVTQVCLEQTG